VRFSIFIILNYLELAQSKDARKAVIVSMGLASEICCLHGYLKLHPLACTASFFSDAQKAQYIFTYITVL